MNLESSDQIKTYDWHSFKQVWPFGIIAFACAIGAFAFSRSDGLKILSLVLGVGFTICGIGCFLPGATSINSSKRTLSRQIFFLGRYPVWQRNYSVHDFDAIIIHQREGGDRNNCFVGLNRISGWKLWITYFENTPGGITSSRAKDLAEQLSRDLQMPIKTIG